MVRKVASTSHSQSEDLTQGLMMLDWAQELFPLPRSLTGQGVRDTLAYLQRVNPDLKLESAKTGEKIFDWEIPREWKIRDGYIEHLGSGEKFAQFTESNLHVVGYSSPVDIVLSLENLLPRIFSDPANPNAIPYVTSYYHDAWGFCLPSNVVRNLPPGEYRAFIDSELFEGELNYAHGLVRGSTKKEVFFTSYICHPSMANNELSGPVLLSALLQALKKRFPTPRLSYRFVLAPETLGSLTYLRNYLDELRANVICGFNLSCVGDERAYSHVLSRNGNTLADRALEAAFVGLPNTQVYSFLERGSDERQYCAPGVDLPFAGFCKSKYGEFPEYHTSHDNFDVVTARGLQESFNLMFTIIEAFENGLYPRVNVLGEPQLSKRGLYPAWSTKAPREEVRNRMNIIAYCDGSHSIFDIALAVNQPLSLVLREIEQLEGQGLIDYSGL